MSSERPLALAGIRVLDLSRLTPGPYGSMLLGDMGADVIMVEEAGKPSGRRAGRKLQATVRGDDYSEEGRRQVAYYALGRNKRSIRINLKSAEGQEVFYCLAASADVVLEGFRPGVARRLGVDYATLSARNPRLVYCSLSGYGQTGPYAQLVGHDINYVSIGGALGMIGRQGRPPAIPMNTIADYAGGGLMAAFAICVALLARRRTGRGQHIDLAMSDGVLSLLTGIGALHFSEGLELEPESHRMNGGEAYYNTYETADGKWISIGSVEPWFFARLCEILGRPAYAEVQYDAAKREEIKEYLREQFKTKTRAEWFALLKEEDVCVAPVYTLEEAFADPHARTRGMLAELSAPGIGMVRQVGVGPKLSETPGQVRAPAPLPGQHTDELLKECGYAAEAIAAYRAKEVVA